MRSWLLVSAIVATLPVAAWSQTRGALHHLRLTVVDADDQTRLPCRVSIQGDDGIWYFPHSEVPGGSAVAYRKPSLSDPKIVEMHTTLSADRFGLDLPDGRYAVIVERGKDYHPESRTIVIAGGPATATITLRRWVDPAGLGWYSGETHVHRTLDDLPNLMRAEDLNVAFPLLDWVRDAGVAPTARRDATFPAAWPEIIRVDETHVIFPRNTEYEIFTIKQTRHTLGAFFVVNQQTPLDLGVPPVGPVARRAHGEGALIELDKHSWPWSMTLVPIMPVDLYELANNHVWRTTFGIPGFGEPPADYMQIERNERGFTERGWLDFGFKNYYALLNCGFRLRPTAGTASGVHPVPLGFGRVYVHLLDGFDGRAWLRGLNEGRSFVTTGPMLFVTLDGHDPGHPFPPEEGGRSHRLRGQAISGQPLDRIEIIQNGVITRTIQPANHHDARGAFTSLIDEPFVIDGSSWLAVRCFEARPDGRPRFAHTGPFHIDVPGRPLRPVRAEVDYLIQRVEAQIKRSAGVLPEAAIEEYRTSLRIYQELAETAR